MASGKLCIILHPLKWLNLSLWMNCSDSITHNEDIILLNPILLLTHICFLEFLGRITQKEIRISFVLIKHVSNNTLTTVSLEVSLITFVLILHAKTMTYINFLKAKLSIKTKTRSNSYIISSSFPAFMQPINITV